MANFETGFCSPVEYSQYKPDRLREIELAVNGLYTLMFDLGDRSPTGAAKFPARVNKIKEPESGIRPVHFTILDPDMANSLEAVGLFNDGLYQPYSQGKIRVGKKPVQEGYFRDYACDGDLEQQLQDLISRENMVVA